MKQRWLPEFDYPDVDAPQPELVTAGVADEEREAPFAEVLPGQRGLFTAERELVGQIEAALASGRFADARRHRDALVALEGPSARTRELGTLEVVGDAGFWDRPQPVVLDEWLTLHRHLDALPNFRRLICDGGLSRLLERHAPTELVQAAPAMLAPLTNRQCAAARKRMKQLDADKAVEASADSFDVFSGDVVHEAAGAVAQFAGLRRGEITSLTSRQSEEPLKLVRRRSLRPRGHHVPRSIRRT